ncbi:MAG: preprotein translocase subunit SecA [Calditrichaeota bacterium]|nr:preprotein translocase subunit SecA [Spirochaetales bacterium]RQV98534.1 MAG: preprotein translocase subunit SecA [Calditrichota bacterium]
MLEKIVTALVGSKHERDLKKLIPLLHRINEKESWAMSLKKEDFPLKTAEFRKRLSGGETTDDLLPEAFALAREAARRTLGERPYDVQLLGGIVLHQGKIMEMKTGEGKTLSSVAASYLNSLEGKGVHVVTVNDYLAERDAQWMDPVFSYLGVTVGAILSNMDPEARQVEYAKDITYGTNNEFGFDYLRDNMRWDFSKKSQKHHHYCIIDEIDSILIDEARTPLIISGAVEEATGKFKVADQLIKKLVECEKDPATGDYPLDDPLSKEQPPGDYKLDEKSKRVVFTDEGMNHIEEELLKRNEIQGSLFDEQNFEWIHYITQAMKAHHLFHLDVDYVIQDNQVQIVDEFTGRVLHGRRYSEGLHQAIEAKENIKIAKRNRTLASITFQNYFRMYDKISGMTGTADTEAREFTKIYDLDVVVIPTNRPVKRIDDNDVIYLNEQFKFNAICDDIERIHKTGQPILVGTVSVEKSEVLSALLRKRGIRHEILNAKNHHREALIIGEAGAKGSVTIATNMAGRGTDIKLGGNLDMRVRKKIGTDASAEQFKEAMEKEMVQWRKDNQEIKELGGLYVIGTERHESRRIDNQLRGRSGRQGDPGHSQFYISLDDTLMRLFGGERFKSLMGRLGMEGGEPIYHNLINKSIERAQSRVEDRNYEIRKHLLDYDDVLNTQRNFIYELRDNILTSSSLLEDIIETGYEINKILFSDYKSDLKHGKKEDALFRLMDRLKNNFFYIPDDSSDDLLALQPDELEQKVSTELKAEMDDKIQMVGHDQIKQFVTFDYLRNLDQKWQEHLENLDALREAVSLRSYAQKNPLAEYKREGFEIFSQLNEDVKIAVTRKIFKVKIRKEREPVQARARQRIAPAQADHRAIGSFGAVRNQERAEASGGAVQVKRAEPKVGRNDLCPCGSGKKYKKCCGA